MGFGNIFQGGVPVLKKTGLSHEKKKLSRHSDIGDIIFWLKIVTRTHTHTHIYIFILRERERKMEREGEKENRRAEEQERKKDIKTKEIGIYARFYHGRCSPLLTFNHPSLSSSFTHPVASIRTPYLVPLVSPRSWTKKLCATGEHISASAAARNTQGT